jgi:tetratricopeptide (TPR) repeat protein
LLRPFLILLLLFKVEYGDAMRLLWLSFLVLLLGLGVEAQEEDTWTLYLGIDDYYLQFEDISAFLDRVVVKLREENVEVVYVLDYLVNNRSPSVVIIETDLEGQLLTLASAEQPVRAVSSMLRSQFGYGAFTVRDLSRAEAVDAFVGFSLYTLRNCERALAYLGNSERFMYEPSLAEAMAFYAGNCSLLQSELISATEYFRQSIEGSRSFPASLNLAWTFIQIGESRKAFETFDEMFPSALSRTDPTFFVNLLIHRAQLSILAVSIAWNKLTDGA